MDNKQIRLENLRALIREARGTANLARTAGTDPNYLSQITTGRRNVGEDLARDLERGMKKPAGWMDQIHSVQEVDLPRARVPEVTWDSLRRQQDQHVVREEPRAWKTENFVSTDKTVSEQAFALRVHGDSMLNPTGSPTYPDGSRVIVDPTLTPKHRDRIIVALPDGDVVFRQLVNEGTRAYLKPLNTSYPLIEMPPAAEVRGVIVQTIIDE